METIVALLAFGALLVTWVVVPTRTRKPGS